MYSFTNRFSGPTLHQRIGMINSRRSSSLAGWRYVAWLTIMSIMAFACHHKPVDYQGTVFRHSAFPLTNATRTLANKLDKARIPWYRQSSLLMPDKKIKINGQQVTEIIPFTYPEILCLKNSHLSLKNTPLEDIKLFVNGQVTTPVSLSALTFDEVDDLLVYQKWDDATGADKFPEKYRIFISTTPKGSKADSLRIQWKQFLLTNAVSDYPLGNSNTFSMNQLLEATFFGNKLAFVQITKDNYLKLIDEYTDDIELYINGLPVDSKSVESVHVRDVDRLYTRERPFNEWNDGLDRQTRFVLYIQTSPKRAKRDSSYYVFSPFYSGDF